MGHLTRRDSQIWFGNGLEVFIAGQNALGTNYEVSWKPPGAG